jgi:hypothetical protein
MSDTWHHIPDVLFIVDTLSLKTSDEYMQATLCITLLEVAEIHVISEKCGLFYINAC